MSTERAQRTQLPAAAESDGQLASDPEADPRRGTPRNAVAEPLVRLLRVEDVARVLNLSRKAVYALGARGLLPRIKVGRQVRFHPRDVRRFLRAAGEAGDE